MKKRAFIFTAVLFVGLIAKPGVAGIHFGMAAAVQAKVDELDKKVISGKARFVNGATNSTANAPTLNSKPVVRAAGNPTDGTWKISPNKVRARVVDIRFDRLAGGLVPAKMTNACWITYDRSLPSRSILLDCPYKIKEDVYAGLWVTLGDYEVMIEDDANGIYSDPSSQTRLTSTRPSSGGQFVPVSYNSVPGASRFDSPLDLTKQDTVPVMKLVVDGIHTMQMTAANGILTLVDGAPLGVTAFVGGIPRIAVYTSTPSSAFNYFQGPPYVGYPGDIKVVYDASDQPNAFTISGSFPGTCGQPSGFGGGSVFRVPWFGSGGDLWGDYLGRDNSGTIGGVTRNPGTAPTVGGTYAEIFSFQELSTIGSTTNFKYKCQSNPPAPTSGTDYSSDVPSFTPDEQVQMTLFLN